jgi:SAM-dependent methyltransferase
MQQPDPAKLDVFMGKMLNDMGAAASAALVLIGDKLGLYKALAEIGPATPKALADKTGTAERYVREWLAAQAAAGYVQYLAANGTFAMTPEQATALANDSSPAFVGGAFEILSAMFQDEPKVTAAFKTGKGVGWHEHCPCLFSGTERFFRPGYAANLVQNWLPALEGVVAKLERGAKVADVGCGHGASTVVMAKAYPKSKFFGYDYHGPSVEHARQSAKDAGVADRCTFEVAPAKSYPGSGYDLVALFDCLHDMGDPVGAAGHIRQSLATDGTFLLVEPAAADTVEGNLNPVGRMFYAASTMLCVPASLSQEVGMALGAQAGEGRLREVVAAGGFKHFRKATATPFNLVFEVKP